jgi:hypothetical protein
VTPAHLRARERVDLDDMARRLGISVDDVRTLEAISTGLWEVTVLAQYLAALGFTLRVVAVNENGREDEIQ